MMMIIKMMVMMKMMMMASGWRPRGGKRAQRTGPQVGSDLFRRDAELGQKLMTCGQPGPFSESQVQQLQAAVLLSKCWGNKVD